MVCVLPLPVWPYAKQVASAPPPSRQSLTRGLTASWYTSALVDVSPKARSKEKAEDSTRRVQSTLVLGSCTTM